MGRSAFTEHCDSMSAPSRTETVIKCSRSPPTAPLARSCRSADRETLRASADPRPSTPRTVSDQPSMKLKHGHAGLGLRREPAALEQLAFSVAKKLSAMALS